MSSPAKNDPQERLAVLRQIIRDETSATQEEFCQALREKDFVVTQSTVSRDLRRIGAVKTINSDGVIIYKLPSEFHAMSTQPNHDLTGLITDFQHNENVIVVHTTPGSASLVARHLDGKRKSFGILGTLAGDDAIFIIPASVKKIKHIIKKIKEEFW